MAKHIDFELFSSLFYYDETSPTFLRYREDHTPAGTIPKDDYSVVEVLDMGLFKVHRIIFCIMSGGINSELIIDHLDRNKRNNNIWNLCETTQSQNMYNRAYTKRANGLPKNIYVSKSRPPDNNGRDYLTAQIKNPNTNKRISKSGYDLDTLLLWIETKKAEFEKSII